MSEPENFLSRWARLKRQGDQAVQAGDPAEAPRIATAAAAAPDAAAEASREADPADETKASPSAEPGFDISKLPPIDSITATTDIRAFLAPGVPPDLARAALRRAWVVDPAIRDFVGIAENQWDFNDPNSIPGFGSLGPLDDVRQLVARVFGDARDLSEETAAEAEKSSAVEAPQSDSIAVKVQESTATEGDLLRQDGAQAPLTPAQSALGGEPSVAPQQRNEGEQSTPPAEIPLRRQHGGALPE